MYHRFFGMSAIIGGLSSIRVLSEIQMLWVVYGWRGEWREEEFFFKIIYIEQITIYP
jgi:hypothetical protein